MDVQNITATKDILAIPNIKIFSTLLESLDTYKLTYANYFINKYDILFNDCPITNNSYRSADVKEIINNNNFKEYYKYVTLLDDNPLNTIKYVYNPISPDLKNINTPIIDLDKKKIKIIIYRILLYIKFIIKQIVGSRLTNNNNPDYIRDNNNDYYKSYGITAAMSQELTALISYINNHFITDTLKLEDINDHIKNRGLYKYTLDMHSGNTDSRIFFAERTYIFEHQITAIGNNIKLLNISPDDKKYSSILANMIWYKWWLPNSLETNAGYTSTNASGYLSATASQSVTSGYPSDSGYPSTIRTLNSRPSRTLMQSDFSTEKKYMKYKMKYLQLKKILNF